jgi:hypothetical protein
VGKRCSSNQGKLPATSDNLVAWCGEGIEGKGRRGGEERERMAAAATSRSCSGEDLERRERGPSGRPGAKRHKGVFGDRISEQECTVHGVLNLNFL